MKNYWLKEKPKVSGGFPQDDALTLQQMAGDGSCDLTIWYDNQFVQNELLEPNWLEKCENLRLQHTPVLAGTTTGTVYLKCGQSTIAIQTFVIMSNGSAVFQDIYRSKVKVVSIKQNVHTGEMYFVWNKKPADHYYVISYEYSLECQWNDDQ